jgi:hypothetical protein
MAQLRHHVCPVTPRHLHGKLGRRHLHPARAWVCGWGWGNGGFLGLPRALASPLPGEEAPRHPWRTPWATLASAAAGATVPQHLLPNGVSEAGKGPRAPPSHKRQLAWPSATDTNTTYHRNHRGGQLLRDGQGAAGCRVMLAGQARTLLPINHGPCVSQPEPRRHWPRRGAP